MSKINSTLKIFFQISNLILIIFYIYPGSIMGFFLYGSFDLQPTITADFFNISSNHFYAFTFLSFIAILAYHTHRYLNFIIMYLFLLSIILELLHLIISERSFQISDLLGNILGVFLILTIYKIWRRIKF